MPCGETKRVGGRTKAIHHSIVARAVNYATVAFGRVEISLQTIGQDKFLVLQLLVRGAACHASRPTIDQLTSYSREFPYQARKS